MDLVVFDLIVSSSNSKVRIVSSTAAPRAPFREGDYWQFLTASVVLAFLMFIFGCMTRY
jgi:hypothetical protein